MGCIDIRPTRMTSADEQANSTSYSVEYRATCTNYLDGPQQIASFGGFPQVGITSYSYGFSSDTDALCRRIYGFKRGQSGKSGNAGNGTYFYWLFNVDFVWERESDPTKQTGTVTPFFVDMVKPAFTGEFLDFVGPNKVSKGITNSNFPVNTKMPICNSAQTPVIPAPEIRGTMEGYRVTKIVKNWFDFSAYLNKTNHETTSITMKDYANYRGTNGATLLNRSLETKSLLLANVQTSILTIYDRRWLEVTCEYLVNDWNHYELDRGTMIYANNGDPDGRGGTFSAADFATGASRMVPVRGPNGNDIREPLLFNGEGKPLTTQKPENAVYLKFGMYQSTDFSPLLNAGFLGGI